MMLDRRMPSTDPYIAPDTVNMPEDGVYDGIHSFKRGFQLSGFQLSGVHQSPRFVLFQGRHSAFIRQNSAPVRSISLLLSAIVGKGPVQHPNNVDSTLSLTL